MADLTVIMSVYIKDSLSNLKLAISSILEQESISADLLIAVDGDISYECEEYLRSLARLDSRVKTFFFSENLGLASRLNFLIDESLRMPAVKYIARMDADDVSLPERLIKQVRFMDLNPDVGVCGTSVIEIDENGKRVFEKTMPKEHGILMSQIIGKCPFNHPTVMFRASVFESGLRYKSYLKNTQDYYFWVDLAACGVKFANLNEPLLLYRVDDDFYNRRGLSKAVNDFKARIYAMHKLKIWSIENLVTSIALFTLRISPSWVKRLSYKYLR